MGEQDKRLSVFSKLEEFAFYGFPDFDDEQRKIYLSFEEQEWQVILKCRSLHTQIYCALQLGYFKAKHFFFRFSLNNIAQADTNFLLLTYFKNKTLKTFSLTKHEYYLQRTMICHLFDYQSWSDKFYSQLENKAQHLAKLDITPQFIAQELLMFLQSKKIVRPGYSTIKKIIIQALQEERDRMAAYLTAHLTNRQIKQLDQLLKTDTTISELAALKQDAKNFNYTVMSNERDKYHVLHPLHEIAKGVLPALAISKQNIEHYANLVHYYTAYDLERLDGMQKYLYLLCYAFHRYQKMTDTLVDAVVFHSKKLAKETKEKADLLFVSDHLKFDKKFGKAVFTLADENLTSEKARKKAFKIMSGKDIQAAVENIINKPKRKQELKWQERNKVIASYTQHLKPPFEKIEFASLLPNNPLLGAIQWMKSIFESGKPLSQQPFDAFPKDIISKRLRPYIITADKEGKEVMNANLYAILVYDQIVKQLQTGALHVEDSLRHKTFFHELNTFDEKAKTVDTANIPWFQKTCEERVESLIQELTQLWNQFNDQLKRGQIKHLKYDKDKKDVLWVKPKIIKEDDEEAQRILYGQIPSYDIADVLRFVNEKTNFLSSFTPLQPRYKKQELDEDHIIAILISQATNIGNHKMSQTSDISYHVLESTYQQYMRLSTLKNAHDKIANAISLLPVFPYYTFDLDELLYGALDGQKFEMITPTAKACHSRKYFKTGRGIVAYTLLCNHVPVQCDLISPHEHESYFAFDVWYNNTSLIKPTVVTSDSHGINKANFAILHWFGADFRPRFTNLKKEIKNVFCGTDITEYAQYLVQPVKQINKQIIFDGQTSINQIVTCLASKETTQSNLVKKLCGLPAQNKIRQAVFEYDKLVRSVYILKCALDPTVLINSHRSQNRIESYHNLRAAISRTGGGKELLGRTDLEAAISNQCNRLVAVSIIYYNSEILSLLLKIFPKKVKKSSPAAWRHLHFSGHFAFYIHKKLLSLIEIVKGIKL